MESLRLLNLADTKLSDTDRRVLDDGLRAAASMDGEQFLEPFQRRLRELVDLIGARNEMRSRYGDRLDRLKAALQVMERLPPDEDLVLLRTLYSMVVDEMERFLDLSRPNVELNEKAELKKQISISRRLGLLSRSLLKMEGAETRGR